MKKALGLTLSRLPGPVMITGHTGFKGTWMTLLFQSLGVPVVGYSLEPAKNSLFERLNRRGCVPEVFADIRNFDELKKFIEQHQPSAIFHLAAQPLVLESYKSPRLTFEINAQGTANLLDLASKFAFIESVSVITTDKVYKNLGEGRKFVEDDPLEGIDPYSASKVGAEAAVCAWQNLVRLYGGPTISSYRAGNVIGGGDMADDRLLPDLIRSFQSGNSVRIRNEQSTRPWQHVLDPLIGYVLASEYSIQTRQSSNYNFGPGGTNLKVREVVDIAISEWSADEKRVKFESDEFHRESETLDLDSTKAKNRLGWIPNWTQEQSVRSTVNWWKNLDTGRYSALESCLSDIEKVT